ncbi:hypothetical protein [Luteolibacter soli]|uniref:DUF3592 domain-containing protein n=1 Tax=Luteolibacter soli TaxID=3135280 RepID=A0ABU9ATJ4_9BACT
MKPRTIVTLAIVVTVAGAAAFTYAKLTIPFHYADRLINRDAASHLLSLQAKGEQSPEVLATRYVFFRTDYQESVPTRIQVSSKKVAADTIRVRVYDPHCEDDSTDSSIERVYLQKDQSQRWIPVRVEWSHRGRGRFGWTTEPTT